MAKLRSAWQLATQVALTVPVGIAFTDLVASVMKMEGQSMQPTFNPRHGRTWGACDLVLVEKVSYKLLHKYQRGDVAVLWAPDNPFQQITKRVIALEDDVVYDDSKGTHETVPKGRCWIEGDNAAASCDSRTLYGPVPLGLLEGRAVCIIWPPSRIGMVQRSEPKGKVITNRSLRV